MWDAIKSRFGGNDESKKIQKYILKQEFEGFSVSNSEGLHKGYARSLPSAWSQVSLIMGTKPGVDSLSFDDLYNNLRAYRNDVKGSIAISSTTQTYEPKHHHTPCLLNNQVCPQLLDHEALNTDDIELRRNGLDMASCRHFARECRIKGNQDNRRRDAWNSGNKDGSRTGKKEDSKALVTIDGEGVDWTSHSEEDEDYALMACNNSESDTEVTSCSNECKESYAKLKKLYDAQREQLSDASIEIKAYTQGLKKVEAQLVAHQQGQLWYEQKIKFMKIDLDDKTDVLTYHKKLLAEAMKEKEDLKAKVEKWHNSSKNLVLQSVFMNKESELEKQPLYDRFVTAEGMHVVPPPMTGNYMPSGPDIEVDYSQFTYGPKQTQPSESETQTKCQPKVWSDAPIIEEYESDSEDEYVSIPTKEQETPSFANQQVKTPRETVKNQYTHSKNPKVDNKKLGYGFTARACFVCGSLNHLIRDCDFHEKRMAKQAELNNGLNRNSSQREIRQIWNNVQRVNKQNQFVPSAVLTRTGKIPVNTTRTSGTKNISTARHNFNRQALVLLGGKGKLLLSPQQVVIRDHKDTTGTKSPNTMVDPALETVSLSKDPLADSSPNSLVPKRNYHFIILCAGFIHKGALHNKGIVTVGFPDTYKEYNALLANIKRH
ncbi:ribonuclease H-like domain-containing protein [Tanacetum coccineum]